VAVQNEGQLTDGGLESSKAFRRRAVEHDADHDQRASLDAIGRDHGSDRKHVAFLEQALGPAVAGGGAYVDLLRQLRIAEPAIRLQQAQKAAINAVELSRHERFFLFLRYLYRSLPSISINAIVGIHYRNSFESLSLGTSDRFPCWNIRRGAPPCWKNSSVIRSPAARRRSRNCRGCPSIWAVVSRSMPSARTATPGSPSAATRSASSNTSCRTPLPPTPIPW